jgi:thiamine pyrophosphate-dependent acetolactate synthase large subunit-like protein
MPVLSGKNALLDLLQQEGADIVFGNPGTTEPPLMDALSMDDRSVKYSGFRKRQWSTWPTAQGLGVAAHRASTVDQTVELLRRHFNSDRPVLIDVEIDRGVALAEEGHR